MNVNFVLDKLNFPLVVKVEKESIIDLFDSKDEFQNKFKNYNIKQICVDKDSNQLCLIIEKSKTLEDLGYSFESGI